jgi:D-alanyl-D-alanine-carboxypeptidase/D-alanyl-D-alanine-endopeptidase
MSTIVEPTDAQLQALVEPYLSKQTSGLAFAIGCASPTFQKLFVQGSLFNQNNVALELGPNTYFELGSLSKTFTTTLCGFLGGQHQPKWENQSVKDYSRAFKRDGIQVGSQFHPIPLLALANFTSGLPADNLGSKGTVPKFLPIPYSPAAMLGYLNGTTTLQPNKISEAYTYSNLAFSILSQIIPLFSAKTASQDFPELMSEWVFGPLNMQNSHYFEDIFLDQLAVGYVYPGAVAGVPGHNVFPAYYGGGGVVSTPGDILTWLQFNMGILTNNQLSLVLQKTQSPSTNITAGGATRLGLGWFIIDPSSSGPGSVFKNGALNGYSSYLQFLPWIGLSAPSQAGAFVLTNSSKLKTSSQKPADQTIVQAVLAIMQGKTPA